LQQRRPSAANRTAGFRVAAQFVRRLPGTQLCHDRCRAGQQEPEEERVPLLPIILWVGVPVVLIGGGYWVFHAMQ
jgi:hypothetical protein